MNSHLKSVLKHTETYVQNLGLKKEITYLYTKNQKLNEVLYNLHLQNAANKWGILRYILTKTFRVKWKKYGKYKTINKNYKNLTTRQFAHKRARKVRTLSTNAPKI
jgi:hypothetical protein